MPTNHPEKKKNSRKKANYSKQIDSVVLLLAVAEKIYTLAISSPQKGWLTVRMHMVADF